MNGEAEEIERQRSRGESAEDAPSADAARNVPATMQRLRDQSTEIAVLAGGLAHEIRNPLSTISLNLDLMTEELRRDSDNPTNRRMLQQVQTIQKACGGLEQTLNEFLQFTRAGELELAEVDLNDVVEEFIAFYQPDAKKRRIEISPHLAAGLPPVAADRVLLQQVLLNLVQNAQHAMPVGGTIEVQTYPQESKVLLELIDNGTGMDERTRARMFEAFYSTRSGGSGLGLPTVKKIVEAHHGTIECESEPGRGTRFTIALPAAGLSG